MNKIIAVDESLFLHDDIGKQIWVVGILDTQTKDLLLDIIYKGNSDGLKSFIYNHRAPDIHIDMMVGMAIYF